jgi:serine/threonine protein kinase
VDPLLGRKLGDRYTLLRRLGRGPGLYEAIDGEANRFAIRVLAADGHADPAAARRFVREARTLLTIRSPHVVSLVDADFDQALGRPFIVMELLHGIDLGRVIDKHGALEPRVAIPLFVQACKGLAVAHEHRNIHRDVRPENLFLQEQPSGELVVKLTGFGVVKSLSDAAEGYDVTRASDVLGHPMYMSPEQARNPTAVDERSDVWSLGATLFHALCGQPPWDRDLVAGALLLQIGTSEPTHAQDKAPWLDPELVDVVHQTLRRDPDRRFASMQLLSEALAPLSRKRRVLLKDLAPLPSDLRHRVAPRTAPANAEAHGPATVSTSPAALSPIGGGEAAPVSTLAPAAMLELERRRASARTTQIVAVTVGVLVTALLGGYLGWELLFKP